MKFLFRLFEETLTKREKEFSKQIQILMKSRDKDCGSSSPKFEAMQNTSKKSNLIERNLGGLFFNK